MRRAARNRCRHRNPASWLWCLATVIAADAAAAEPAAAIDPWDYNYCGGKPVYPEIGYTFATLCGPRNQVALGRRGRLMWSFPSESDPGNGERGSRQLTAEELNRLSLLAEVVQLADPPAPAPGAVVYQLGINFPGRPSKRLHAARDDRYTPAGALAGTLLDLVPVRPDLPDCGGPAVFFDPVQLPGSRTPLAFTDIHAVRERPRGVE
jgi:hypothetical protein